MLCKAEINLEVPPGIFNLGFTISTVLDYSHYGGPKGLWDRIMASSFQVSPRWCQKFIVEASLQETSSPALLKGHGSRLQWTHLTSQILLL
jgi:hypothetical protein